MNDLEKNLFLLFKKAAESERKAQQMYQEIIQNLRDKDLIEIFQSFLEDEKKHEKEVIKRYNELKKKLKSIEEDQTDF